MSKEEMLIALNLAADSVVTDDKRAEMTRVKILDGITAAQDFIMDKTNLQDDIKQLREEADARMVEIRLGTKYAIASLLAWSATLVFMLYNI